MSEGNLPKQCSGSLVASSGVLFRLGALILGSSENLHFKPRLWSFLVQSVGAESWEEMGMVCLRQNLGLCTCVRLQRFSYKPTKTFFMLRVFNNVVLN